MGRNVRPSQLDSGLARIDHALTSRATLFARYNDSPSFNEFGSTQINRLDLRFKKPDSGTQPAAQHALDASICAATNPRPKRTPVGRAPARPNPSGCDLEPMTTYLFPAAGYLQCAGAVFHRRRRPGGDRPRGTRAASASFRPSESTAWKAGAHTVRFGADYRRMVPIRRDATRRAQRHRRRHHFADR